MLIADAFTMSDETYGYRRIHAQLARWGVPCGPELVRSIMRELDLQPCQPRPWRFNLTEQDGPRAPHPRPASNRTSPPTRRATKLIGDITYIPTWEGWLYLATVIDCHTRMVIGYAMADNYKTPLIVGRPHRTRRATSRSTPTRSSTPIAAATTRPTSSPAPSRELGLRQSVGRTGICYDNAMAESFFAALKNERVHRTAYPTREHARADVARYIEFWYNTKRLHSGLDYKSPQEALAEWTNEQEAA